MSQLDQRVRPVMILRIDCTPFIHSIEAAVDARSSCPYCGLHLSRDHVIAPVAERSVTPSTTRSSSVSRNGSVALPENSAKTAALVRLLKASAPGVKSLVFSQVRTLLEWCLRHRINDSDPNVIFWLCARLARSGPDTSTGSRRPCTRKASRLAGTSSAERPATTLTIDWRFRGSCSFDGSMRQEKREEVVKSFTIPNKTAVAGSKEDRDNPMVMLLSLQVRSSSLLLSFPDVDSSRADDLPVAIRPELSDSISRWRARSS